MTRPVGCVRYMWLAATSGVALFVAGCRVPPDFEETPPLRLPSQFSAPTMVPGMTDPSLGLIVDADPHPQMQGYAHRLAAGIATEIQLMSGSTIVVPYTDLAAQAPVLLPAYESIRDPGQETMTEPLQNLPPVFDVPEAPPASDRLLVVQIINVRPYVPMATTLRLSVVESQSGTVVGQTTAVWDAAAPKAQCCDSDCEKRHKHCWYPDCDPSPLQNSPEGMLKHVAQQVAVWYQQTLPQPIVVASETMTTN